MVNVFVTANDPIIAARELPDMLVPRMCLEAAEILCGANWNMILGKNEKTPHRHEVQEDDPPWMRTLAQRRHPAVLWAGASVHNYDWVFAWYKELASEHLMRYGKRTSYCEAYLQCARYLRESRSRFEHLTERMPFIITTEYDDIRNINNSIVWRYRILMIYKYAYLYKRNVRWTNCDMPKWLHNERVHAWLRRKYGKPRRKLPREIETEMKMFSEKNWRQIQSFQS